MNPQNMMAEKRNQTGKTTCVISSTGHSGEDTSDFWWWRCGQWFPGLGVRRVWLQRGMRKLFMATETFSIWLSWLLYVCIHLSNSWNVHLNECTLLYASTIPVILILKVSEWKSLSHVQLFVTPWTIQSTEFSRPVDWVNLHKGCWGWVQDQYWREYCTSFPCHSVGKESACNVGDLGS